MGGCGSDLVVADMQLVVSWLLANCYDFCNESIGNLSNNWVTGDL